MRRPPPVATEADLDAADHQLALRGNALIAVTAPVLVPTLAMLVVYLWNLVPLRRLLPWFGAVTVLSLGLSIVAGLAWRARRAGRTSPIEVLVPLCIAGLGGLVGVCELVLVIEHQPGGHSDLPAMVLQLFVAGIAAAAVLSFGPVSRNFAAFQVPANGLNCIAILVGSNHVPRFLAPIALMYLAMLAGSHRLMTTAMRTALVGQFRSERLSDELRVERDRARAANDALSHQATHDPLTGVANRVRFFDQLNAALAMARRRGELVAVMFIDLDHFKALNDASGHATGDAVLLEMARRLTGEVRSTDLVARQGGDEFTVLLVAPDSAAAAVEVAERMCRRLNEPFVVGTRTFHLTASLGLALNDDLQTDPDVIMRDADLALYRAKAAGRNRVEILDGSLRQALESRRDDELELHRAFDNGEITAWLQPVVDMRSGTVVGAEALARWLHPERGLLLPGSFLPLVHDFGLDERLDEAMLDRALQSVRALNDRGLVPPTFRISFNLDCRRSSLAGMVDRFEAAAVEGQPISQVAIELTENAVVTQATARPALERARALGMVVLLDDFGTGESPLSLVRDLPLDVIKIDRRFVHGMATHQADVAVVAAVIELARRLDVLVVAEGVEQPADVDRLITMGCELGQGFRYSQAVPLEEFTDLLGANRLGAHVDGHGDGRVYGRGDGRAQGHNDVDTGEDAAGEVRPVLW